jgi:hypothetical protein
MSFETNVGRRSRRKQLVFARGVGEHGGFGTSVALHLL